MPVDMQELVPVADYRGIILFALALNLEGHHKVIRFDCQTARISSANQGAAYMAERRSQTPMASPMRVMIPSG